MSNEVEYGDAPTIEWPSGAGVEYGLVSMPLLEIAERTASAIVHDEDVSAVILDSDPRLPVSFVSEPKVAGDAVALIADEKVEERALRRFVEAKIGPAVRWHSGPL